MAESMLKVAAVASLDLQAGETPAILGERVREACGKSVRRINRFIQLALIGAHDCVGSRSLAADTAVYLATGQGNVADTAQMMRDILARGEAPMPFSFINVSSNMAGFYVAQGLELSGANLTVSRHDFSFEAAVQLAGVDLGDGGRALIGAVEECAWPLARHRERLGVAQGTPLSEGSHWLLIDQDEPAPLALIEWSEGFVSREAALAALKAAGLPRDTLLGTGWGIDEAERGEWMRALGLPDCFDYLSGAGYHDTLTALGLCRFIETHPAGRLLHINRGRDGRYQALMLSTCA